MSIMYSCSRCYLTEDKVLTLSLPLATIVDRTPSVPLAMIVAVFTNVTGIACFQIFTPRKQKPGTGSQKIGSERGSVIIKNISATSLLTFSSQM